MTRSVDCPRCVPVAPFWMTTFADMALLLMAFFALLYSFVNIDAHEQTKFAAAIRSSFGTMTLDVVESDNRSNMFSGKTYTDKELKGKSEIVAKLQLSTMSATFMIAMGRDIQGTEDKILPRGEENPTTNQGETTLHR